MTGVVFQARQSTVYRLQQGTCYSPRIPLESCCSTFRERRPFLCPSYTRAYWKAVRTGCAVYTGALLGIQEPHTMVVFPLVVLVLLKFNTKWTRKMISYSLVRIVSWIKQQAPRLNNPAMFSQLLLPCAV